MSEILHRDGAHANSSSLQYDDLAAPPLGLPAILGGPFPNPYQDLAYSRWLVAGADPEGLLNFASPPNAIVYGVAKGLTSGDASSPPSMTIAYPNSKIASFDVLSMRFGCVVNTLGNVAVPEGCNIKVVGTKVDPGDPSATQSELTAFGFTPDTLLGDGTVSLELAANMVEVEFPPTFRELTNMTIEIIQSTTLPLITGIYVDNFNYETLAT
ncbi:MAG: hypothetical protein M4579_002633 [Chaenotheca gracillima]|nr:MAG: hypothetical protein M4579_002633 [Chaenotheca gracillima]